MSQTTNGDKGLGLEGGPDNTFKSEEESISQSGKYIEKQSGLYRSFSHMVEMAGTEVDRDGNSTPPFCYRFKEPYRGVVANLTPRQLKAYLRERLFGSTGTAAELPETALLRTHYNLYWQIKEQESHLFHMISGFATTIVRGNYGNSRSPSTEVYGRFSATALQRFNDMMHALARSGSAILTEAGIKSCWPARSRERALLIWLLHLANVNGSGNRGFDQAVQGPGSPPPDFRDLVSHDEERSSSGTGSGGSTDAGSGGSGSADPQQLAQEFKVWIKRRLFEEPRGFTIAELVSSFQDIVLQQAQRQGDSTMAEIIRDYADTLLEIHQQFMVTETAQSLSNLAVIINDVTGFEAPCDKLFKTAVTFKEANTRIPLFYTEFLLDVLRDEGRVLQLVGDGESRPYKSNDELSAQIDAMITKLKGEGNTTSDQFYMDLLQARNTIHKEETKEPADKINKLWEVCLSHPWIFPTAVRAKDMEPGARFSDQLDAVLGKGGAIVQYKVWVLAAIIGFLEQKGFQETWTVRTQLANLLVGETSTGSPLEKIGLRMNAGLLSDPLMLRPRSTRLSATWTQTANLLANGLKDSLKGRIEERWWPRFAAMLLAALTYGGDAQWVARFVRIWSSMTGESHTDIMKYLDTEKIKKQLKAILEKDKTLMGLMQELESNPVDAEVAGRLVEALFLLENGAGPISRYDDILAALKEHDPQVEAEVQVRVQALSGAYDNNLSP